MDPDVVTFLFTDIEGSTRLWEQHPDAMQAALARHDEILHQAIEAQGGTVFKTVGDAFCAAFFTPGPALAAALAAQQALGKEAWPGGIRLAVRIALHCGRVERRASDFFGPPLNRVARLLVIAHGGQTLLSQAMRDAVASHFPPGASLVSHGSHRLKDLSEPETVYEMRDETLVTDFPPLRSLSNHPNNLPQQITSFIARPREMTAVKDALKTSRLLTLAGAGGSGKTRLALQAAADVLGRFPDGVYLVELAPLGDPSLVARAIADALGIAEEPRSPTETLVDALRAREMLLILDNCEHVLEACARLADLLLKSCPKLRLIATSRELLGITGEQTLRVPSLGLPPDPKRETSASIAGYEAVALFRERAQAVQPTFTITDQNAPVIAAVCVRLDGIPLALELAAARLRTLSVEELNARLDNCFRLLTGGSRTVLPRQQTLRALIDWSYDLLTPSEKATLLRLSVFAGGWTLPAAEAVCMDDGSDGSEPVEDWEVLDLLTSLTDKSLVIADVAAEGSTRYRLLETVRQYAREKLPDAARTHDRHRDYFLSLSEEAAPHLLGAKQREWLDTLDAEHGNLRAALEWSASPLALRMATRLQLYWVLRGSLSEGRDVIARALAGVSDPTEQRVDGLNTAGMLAWRQGDFATAQPLLQESVELARRLNYQAGQASALTSMGVICAKRGDYADAVALYEEALRIRRALGDRPGEGTLLSYLSIALSGMGDYATSTAYQTENLAIQRENGNLQGIAAALSNLGIDAQRQGDYAKAIALQGEVMEICRTLGNRQSLAATLNNTAVVHQLQGSYAAALSLHSEALAIQQGDGDRNGAALSQSGIAQAAISLGRWDEARVALTDCVPWFHQTGNERQLSEVLRMMGDTRAASDPQGAVQLWAAASALPDASHATGGASPDEPQTQRATQVALGDAAYADAWARGKAMSREEAVALALA